MRVPFEVMTLLVMYMVDALEAGVVLAPGDERIHAVRMTLHGRAALCGAGPIAGGVLGRFADATEHVCLACFAEALPSPRKAS